MLIANRMTPARYPARVIATVIPAGAHSERSAARRLTPLARTGRPAGSDPAVNTRQTGTGLNRMAGPDVSVVDRYGRWPLPGAFTQSSQHWTSAVSASPATAGEDR